MMKFGKSRQGVLSIATADNKRRSSITVEEFKLTTKTKAFSNESELVSEKNDFRTVANNTTLTPLSNFNKTQNIDWHSKRPSLGQYQGEIDLQTKNGNPLAKHARAHTTLTGNIDLIQSPMLTVVPPKLELTDPY